MGVSSPRMTLIRIATAVLISALLFASASAFQRSRPHLGGRRMHRTTKTKANATVAPPPPHPIKARKAKEFLIAHNMVRVAHGLKPLKWNKTLAKHALHWANKRVHDCELIHSKSPYGENLFWGLRHHWTPSKVVKNWAKEKLYYDPKTNKCVQGKMCGHYTQIVWSRTSSLGCAKVKCLDDGGYFVICNYDPPGNWLNIGPFDDLKKPQPAAPSPSPPPPSAASFSVPKLSHYRVPSTSLKPLKRLPSIPRSPKPF